MKRILYIAMADIHSQSGGGYANRAFYESLLHHKPDKVDLVQFEEDGTEDDKNSFGVPPKGLMDKLFELSKGTIHRFSPWLLQFIKSRGHNYGCCIINSGILGDLILEIKKYIPVVVMIHHNDEAVFQKDNNRPTTFWGLTSYFVDRNQRKAYQIADLNLFLTEFDKQLFEKKYGKLDVNKNEVVGVYETQNQSRPLVKRALPYNVFVITGALHNVQTIKGIKDFFGHYMSYLEHIYSEGYHLIIAGRRPGKYIQSLQSNDVTIVANPADMNEIVCKAGIFVCPIQVGSGLKLRIMDGLRMGMPILTHEVSARGYEYFSNEKWFQVYSDQNSFIAGLKQIKEVLESEKDLQQIIFDKYCEYFSFEAGDKRFIKAVNKVYGMV